MIPLYVFSLVLGGGFLALSLLGDLFGGHGDVDLVGLDADVGGVHGHVDADAHVHGGDHLEHHVDYASAQAAHVAAKIFSIRTLSYSLFGFGAVGTLLTWLWSGGSALTTAGLAAGTGLASGALINAVFGWVKRSESGALEGEEGYAGLTGRISLPIAASGGKVIVQKAGRRVELRALPHASAGGRGDAASWRTVLVVEMDHGVARVTPVEDGTLLEL